MDCREINRAPFSGSPEAGVLAISGLLTIRSEPLVDTGC